MSESPQDGAGRPAFRRKSAEIVVAALFLFVGILVMTDSVRLGATWAADGPRPGYFPFYIGLIMSLASVLNIVHALRLPAAQNTGFVAVGQLKLVLTVLVPTVLYAVAVGYIGIYVSAVLFIAFFMRWLGRYPWWKVAAVSVGVAVVFFVVFERWFLVPLPKGPLEAWLGLN